MSAALDYAHGIRAVFKRDLLIFMSYRFRLFSQMFAVLFSLLSFYFIAHLVRLSAFGSPSAYFAFAVYGILIMSVLTAATSIPDVFHGELVAGTFERLLVSPMGPVVGVLAMSLFPIFYATFFAALTVLVATLAFGLPVNLAGLPLAMPVAALGTLAFGAFGLLMVAGVCVFKATPGRQYLSAVIGLFGGAYFPLVLLPHWLRWFPYAQPFTPALDLLRHLLLGTRSFEPPWIELLTLAGWVFVLIPLATGALGAAVRASRKRGIILEY
jgi:ABC-2 type transport system permease protein